MRAWFSEERMQQLVYFSLFFIEKELRIEDVNVFQASKALRNCKMRVLKQKHQSLVSALTLCTLYSFMSISFKSTEDSNEMAHNAAFYQCLH